MDIIARTIGACVPIYDYQTAKEYATLLLHAQVGVSVFGALSWAFGGINTITFGFTLFALVALEAGNDRLLRMYTTFVTAMWIMDVVWLSLWGTHVSKATVSRAEFWRQVQRCPTLGGVLRALSLDSHTDAPPHLPRTLTSRTISTSAGSLVQHGRHRGLHHGQVRHRAQIPTRHAVLHLHHPTPADPALVQDVGPRLWRRRRTRRERPVPQHGGTPTHSPTRGARAVRNHAGRTGRIQSPGSVSTAITSADVAGAVGPGVALQASPVIGVRVTERCGASGEPFIEGDP